MQIPTNWPVIQIPEKKETTIKEENQDSREIDAEIIGI